MWRKLSNTRQQIVVILMIVTMYLLVFKSGMTTYYGISKHQHLNTCPIPDLKLWPEGMKSSFLNPSAVVCSQDTDWVYIKNGTYRYSKTALKQHGNFSCEATTLLRKGDFEVLKGLKLKSLKDGDKVVSDFSEVSCTSESTSGKNNKNKSLSTFKTVLPGIVRKEKSFTSNSKRNQQFKLRRMNILIIGFDSISRMAFMRELPKTYQYFTEVLGAVELKQHNTVGAGTPGQLIPIFTGRDSADFKELRKGFPGSKPLDNLPWIWKDMTSLGYVTQYGEDVSANNAFTTRYLGFDKQPTDHYMRPFYLHSEKQYKHHKPYCLGSLPRHKIMFNWISEFYKVYPNQPKFTFLFNSEYTGDFKFSLLNKADQDLKTFLANMKSSGHFNNTGVILMGDHGPRFGPFRATSQGKYEERMPFFSFWFPDWFKSKYNKEISSLKRNANRLSTHFDIHETLQDIIHMSEHGPTLATTYRSRHGTKGTSLLQELPSDRTCLQAGLSIHWCACMESQRMDHDHPTSDVLVQSAAKTLVKVINDIIKPFYDKCRHVKLHKVLSSIMLHHPSGTDDNNSKSSDNNDKNRFLQITVETLPGFSKYEATLEYHYDTNGYTVDSESISRIDRYGDKPKCLELNYPHLREYCYCKKIIKPKTGY